MPKGFCWLLKTIAGFYCCLFFFKIVFHYEFLSYQLLFQKTILKNTNVCADLPIQFFFKIVFHYEFLSYQLLFQKTILKNTNVCADLPIQTLNSTVIVFGNQRNPYGVSFDGVAVNIIHFAWCYGCQLSIVIALSISSDGNFSCVTEPASEKGESLSKTIYFWQSHEILHVLRNPRKPCCRGTLSRE